MDTPSTPGARRTPTPGGRFATTRWSVVRTAGSNEVETAEALATLCESYWDPVYAFARRRGNSVNDAQDLTQAFFVQLLSGDLLRAADPEQGQFRNFLLGAFTNFLANARRAKRAKKRGGDRLHFSLDFESAEERYQVEASGAQTPERLFERRWALTLLENVLEKLRTEYVRIGKGELIQALQPFLAGRDSGSNYDSIAEALGMSAGAVKVAVHRLRKRYGELLRIEIRQTVDHDADVEEEIRYLFTLLGG